MIHSIISYMKQATAIAFVTCISFIAPAQVKLPPEVVPYYWDINIASSSKMHEVQNQYLHLKYNDAYGQLKDVKLTIYNWKREVIADLILDKSFGLNYYSIKLNDIDSHWELDKIYMCELYDESKRKYEWTFKLASLPEKNDLLIDIIVDPVKMKCEDLAEHRIDFYGQINGGKAPYTVQWHVMNNHRTAFLHQPAEATIASPGKTPVIALNQLPDYYVLLFVKDACGNIQQKMVHLICEEKRKRINSLFVEPIQRIEKNKL